MGFNINDAAQKLGVDVASVHKLDKEVDNDGKIGELGESIFDAARETLLAVRTQRNNENQNWSTILKQYAGEFGQKLIDWALEVTGISQNQETQKVSKKEQKLQAQKEAEVKQQMQLKADEIKTYLEKNEDIEGLKMKGLPKGTTLTGMNIITDFSDSSNDDVVIEDAKIKVIKKADAIIISLSYTFNGKSFSVSSKSTDAKLLKQIDDEFDNEYIHDNDIRLNGMKMEDN